MRASENGPVRGRQTLRRAQQSKPSPRDADAGQTADVQASRAPDARRFNKPDLNNCVHDLRLEV